MKKAKLIVSRHSYLNRRTALHPMLSHYNRLKHQRIGDAERHLQKAAVCLLSEQTSKMEYDMILQLMRIAGYAMSKGL